MALRSTYVVAASLTINRSKTQMELLQLREEKATPGWLLLMILVIDDNDDGYCDRIIGECLSVK